MYDQQSKGPAQQQEWLNEFRGQQMEDFSHWDFAQNFSCLEAASLILGIEPGKKENLVSGRIDIVLLRMEADFNRMKAQFGQALRGRLEGKKFQVRGGGHLISVELEELWERSESSGETEELLHWLADPAPAHFYKQVFSRESLTDWLSAIGMKSVYRFDLPVVMKDECASLAALIQKICPVSSKRPTSPFGH